MEQLIETQTQSLESYSTATIKEVLKMCGCNYPQKHGPHDQVQANKLMQMVANRELELACIIMEYSSRLTTRKMNYPMNIAGMSRICESVDLDAELLEFKREDDIDVVTVPAMFGVVNWNKDSKMDTKVDVQTAILAQEIACDAKVDKGKPGNTGKQNSGTFQGYSNMAQVTRSVDTVKLIKFESTEDVSGHNLSMRVYSALKESDPTQIKLISARNSETDPAEIKAKSTYRSEVIPVQKYVKRGNKQEVQTIEESRQFRERGAGLMMPKKLMTNIDLVALVSHAGHAMGANKSGGGKMSPDFYYGLPLDKPMINHLPFVQASNYIKEHRPDVIVNAHVTDSTTANLINQNAMVPVCYTSKSPTPRKDIPQIIKEKGVFSVKEGRMPSVDQRIVNIYDAGPNVQTGEKALKTLTDARTSLETFLETLDSDEDHIFPVHFWSISNYLMAKDPRSQDGKLIYRDDHEIAFNLSRKSNGEIPEGTPPHLARDYYLHLGFQMHKWKVVMSTFPMGSPLPSEALNLAIKTYIVNLVTYRYHKLSYAGILRKSAIQYPNTVMVKDKSQENMNTVIFKRTKFKFFTITSSVQRDVANLDEEMCSSDAYEKFVERKANQIMLDNPLIKKPAVKLKYIRIEATDDDPYGYGGIPIYEEYYGYTDGYDDEAFNKLADLSVRLRELKEIKKNERARAKILKEMEELDDSQQRDDGEDQDEEDDDDVPIAALGPANSEFQ